jgi:hypothetical protein
MITPLTEGLASVAVGIGMVVVVGEMGEATDVEGGIGGID